MEFYCGIDLHARDSFLCVIDSKAKIHLREKVSNDLGTILYKLGSFSSELTSPMAKVLAASEK